MNSSWTRKFLHVLNAKQHAFIDIHEGVTWWAATIHRRGWITMHLPHVGQQQRLLKWSFYSSRLLNSLGRDRHDKILFAFNENSDWEAQWAWLYLCQCHVWLNSFCRYFAHVRHIHCPILECTKVNHSLLRSPEGRTWVVLQQNVKLVSGLEDLTSRGSQTNGWKVDNHLYSQFPGMTESYSRSRRGW